MSDAAIQVIREPNDAAIQVVRVYYNPPENTRLKETYYLVAGKREGEHRCYYKNTQHLRVIYNYVNDVMEGPSYRFSQDGVLMTHSHFKNGIHNGLCRGYRHNGNLQFECTYLDGMYEGECRMYTEAGDYIGSKVYSQGLLVNSR